VKKTLPQNLKLRLNRETLSRLDQVVGGLTALNCPGRSRDFTNCPTCGNTNYITCYSCVNC